MPFIPDTPEIQPKSTGRFVPDNAEQTAIPVQSSVGFVPDKPTSSFIGNLGSVAGKSAVEGIETGLTGTARLLDQIGTIPQRFATTAAGALGLITPKQEELMTNITNRGFRIDPISKALHEGSQNADISGRALQSLADVYQPDPQRSKDFTTQAASMVGSLAPVLAAPYLLPGQIGESEYRRAIAEGDDPDTALNKFRLGAIAAGPLMIAPEVKLGSPLANVVAKPAVTSALFAGQDLGMQKLTNPDAPIDTNRLKLNALFGALFGGFHAIPDAVKSVQELAPDLVPKIANAMREPGKVASIIRDRASQADDAMTAKSLNDAANLIDDKASGIYDFPDTINSGETPVDTLILARKRAADLAQARIEEAAQTLESQLKQNQIGNNESIILNGSPAENQMLALDTKLGVGQGATKERARLQAIIDAERTAAPQPPPEAPLPNMTGQAQEQFSRDTGEGFTPWEANVVSKLRGKTLEQQKQIVDQEVDLAKGTLTPDEQRNALQVKQQIDDAMDAQKANQAQIKAQQNAAKAFAKQQQAAQPPQIINPPEIPESTKIIQDQGSPPVLANKAAETASLNQGSVFGIQSALEQSVPLPQIKPVETPALVNIGRRDLTVSDGTGKPTAKELAMLKEQQRLVDEHLAQENKTNGGKSNAIPKQSADEGVLRQAVPKPENEVELPAVGEGNTKSKELATNKVRKEPLQEPLTKPLDNITEPELKAAAKVQPKIVEQTPEGKAVNPTPALEEGVSKLSTKKQLTVQKEFLAKAARDAAKEAPAMSADKTIRSEAMDMFRRKYDDFVTIHVPNDGTFRIHNTKESLNEFADKVDKQFGKKINAPDFKSRTARKLTPAELAEHRLPNSPMGSESGSINPRIMAHLSGAGIGGATGYWTTTQKPGESDKDFEARRRLNTLIGAVLGSTSITTAGAIKRAYKRNTDKAFALESLRQEATGRERMPEWYLKWRQGPRMTELRTKINNNRAKVKDLVANVNKDVHVPNDQNPYLLGKNSPGRVGERIRQAEEIARSVETNIVDAAKASKLPVDEFINRFNLWLEARHTPYYNKALRERFSGEGEAPRSRFSDEEAAQVLADTGKDGYAKVFESLSAQYKDLTKATRKMLADGGIITKETADAWEKMFPEYVPMNRIMPEDSTDTAIEKFVGGGPGLNVMGTGVYKIKGSDLPVSDIGGNIYANTIDAIRRVEKNRVSQSALEFFRGVGKNTPGIEITKPKFGEDFDPNSQLSVRKNGDRYIIKFTDPKLAQAFSNLNNENLGSLLKLISYPTRWFSQLVTRFSPNFLAVNPLRDRQEVALKLASQGDWKGAVQQLNPANVLAQDPKVVVDWYLKKDTPGAKAFQQMLDDGGAAGGYASSTRSKAEAMIKEMRKSDTNKIIWTKDKFIDFVNFLSEVSEGSTRYRAYKRALDIGSTREEAALAARNSSIDFNQKGTATSQGSALYAFLNPAIQGPINSTKSLLRNPETLAALATAFVGLGVASDEWNRSFDPEWKQKGSLKYARMSGIPIIYGKDENTGDWKFITIPVAYALRPVKAVMDFSTDSIHGDIDYDNIGSELARVGAGVVDSTNPLGSSNIKTAWAPTVSRPLLETWINEKWTGASVVPKWMDADPNIGERAKRYLSSYDTVTGRMANKLSDLAYEKMGADISPERMRYLMAQYTGGPGRTISDLINTSPRVIKALDGSKDAERIRMSEMPIGSAIFHRVSPEVSERQTKEYKDTAEYVKKVKTDDALVRQQAQLFYRDNVEPLDPKDRIPFVESYAKTHTIPDNAIYRGTLINLLKQGLKDRTMIDNLISSLDVKSGERAKFYVDRIKDMPQSEKQDYIMKQVREGMINQEVAAQINSLLPQQDMEKAKAYYKKIKDMPLIEQTEYLKSEKEKGMLSPRIWSYLKEIDRQNEIVPKN